VAVLQTNKQTNKQTNSSTARGLRAIVVARRFRATLVLHTIRMLSQRLREFSGVAAIIKKSKNKNGTPQIPFLYCLWPCFTCCK